VVPRRGCDLVFLKSERMATRSRHSRKAKGRLIAIRAHGDKNELIEAFVLANSVRTISRMAMQWVYILRVRTRWAGDADMRDNFGAKAIEDLKDLGIEPDTIQRFASVKHIEVELYDSGLMTPNGTPMLDVASEIPWEYLLSSATQKAGRFESVLVTRCLANNSNITRTKPRNVLFVESAPGRIGQIYKFADEETRLSAAVKLKENHGLTFARTEPFSKLRATLCTKGWDAVHVTGVDTHQAAWLIEDFYSAVARSEHVIDKSDRLLDGMILRGDHDSELPVGYDELADLLLASKKPPGVVTLNLYYSGARTARELVKRGVYAALGFLDEIDDEFAELFFQAFYWAWCHANKSISHAFLDAWSTMDGDRMHGTSIVIWLGRSMVGHSDASANMATPAKKAARGGR
jgi:hypothetical protein